VSCRKRSKHDVPGASLSKASATSGSNRRLSAFGVTGSAWVRADAGDNSLNQRTINNGRLPRFARNDG
jgi:hypothetical protein